MPIASQRRAEDERAELIPPELLPLFDDVFVVACDRMEEYIVRLALGVFQSTGLEEACRWEAGATIDQAVARAGLDAAVARVPVAWILAMLASRGWLQATVGAGDEIRYRLERPLPALDPDEILQAQEAHDPRCMPSYQIMALAAEHYPAVLRGQNR